METINDISSLSENQFIQILRDILDVTLNRLSSSKESLNINSQIRIELEQLIRSTNPSSTKINSNILPENFKKIFLNFLHDYRRDLERYHIQNSSQSIDEYTLKNFDWTIRIALHDEHLFKCRLPLLNLQLELNNGNHSKNLLLELDEQELTRLIDQMTQIEQTMNNANILLSQ